MRDFLIVAAVCIATVIAVISLVLYSSPLCGEEMMAEKISPDGHYAAALMTRNCGATTPYVAHINLRVIDTKFRAGLFDGAIIGGQVWGSSKYSGERFCWSGPRRLEIGYPPEGSASLRKSWLDVTIGDDYRNPECH